MTESVPMLMTNGGRHRCKQPLPSAMLFRLSTRTASRFSLRVTPRSLTIRRELKHHPCVNTRLDRVMLTELRSTDVALARLPRD